MNLKQYGEILGLEIKVNYYHEQGRYTVKFKGTETKENSKDRFLTSTYGNGTSPDEAMNNYAEVLRGKILVAGWSKDRSEFLVPDYLVGV